MLVERRSLFEQPDNTFLQTLAGRSFTAGLTQLAVPNGSRFRAVTTNPGGSGVLLAIVNIVFQSRTDEFFTLRINPTVGPVASVPVGNRFLGGPVSACQQFADVSVTPMSGGVGLSYSLASTNNARNSEDFHEPFVLPPGYSIGAELSNGSGAATDVSFVTTWLELPIAESP